ncbi:hypothetical protein OH76DRAFT_930840 [Lentinus brumalis]|uniref:Fungal-type protein kinase domain-containing protein n=1 Tax=Lentinus brumalis TaxID=2498619 RepID=A0A371CZN8_9APHY|nr:hypothetical protein OH76DRAFT_930840 [Polyporus brumalis]
MYDRIPKALNQSNLCPDYKFVATPGKMDPADPTRQSVDLGMYPTSLAPKRPSNGSHARIDWSNVDIPIECKDAPTDEDPFDDNTPDATPIAEKRKGALGQILSYAELVFRYQQRAHLFIVDFLGDFVRLVRIDHGGLYVTQKFNYKQQGEKVAEFFYRYSRMSAAQRGHDPSAERIPHASPLGLLMKRMAERPENVDERDYIRAAFDASLDAKWPWWCLDVHVLEKEGMAEERRSVRKFLVGKPHFQAPGVAGRATRGYVALPLTDEGVVGGSFVYLKDAWRVDRQGIEREGAVLQELNSLGIKYVPTLVCHGDIPGQVTKSQDLWKTYHPKEEECPLKRHQHYRLVVEEVGKPLDQFKDGVELVLALACCIDAHQAAHKAGIIHRDISAGNILLWYDAEEGWQGMLNDWELSKRLPADEAAPGGRQPDRTGTWQFMSAHALNDRFRAIIVPDELESFFHVLLFFAIRYLPHNCPDSAVGKFLHLYFDDFTDGVGQFNCGQMKYFAMRTRQIDLALLAGGRDKAKAEIKAVEPLRFHMPGSSEEHPIQRIITTILGWLAAYYALDAIQKGGQDSANNAKSSATRKTAEVTRARSAWTKRHDKESADVAPGSSTRPITPTAPGERSKSQPPTPPYADAEKIMTHDAIIALFTHELKQEDWPEEDKGMDKRPKKGYQPPKDPVADDSKLTTQLMETSGGSKRKRKTDPNPSTPKKKRSRT